MDTLSLLISWLQIVDEATKIPVKAYICLLNLNDLQKHLHHILLIIFQTEQCQQMRIHDGNKYHPKILDVMKIADIAYFDFKELQIYTPNFSI